MKKKAFAVGLALFIAVPGIALAQPSQPQSQSQADRAAMEKAKPAATPGNEANGPRAASASPVDHPFAKGVRFSRSRAPDYRRVSYRENSRLSPPPDDQVWVRAGADALLVRLSDNIVTKVVSDVF